MPDIMNETLADAISKEPLDTGHFVDRVLGDERTRNDMVDLTLHHPHIMVYYHGFYILDKASATRPGLFYRYWFEFAQLLKHRNTYHRQIGIVVISNISKADTEDHFSETLDDYLRCLYDKKILIGIFCARYAGQIIRNKPEYSAPIIRELLAHKHKSSYTGKQEALLDFEILEILEEQYDRKQGMDEIDAFISERTHSLSPKTRKKSLQLVKALDISQVISIGTVRECGDGS